MMVVDNTAEETPATPDNVTVKVKDDEITLTYTNEKPGLTDQSNAVVAKLTDLGYTDIDVTVKGGEVTGVSAKMGVVSYTFTYEMVKAAE